MRIKLEVFIWLVDMDIIACVPPMAIYNKMGGHLGSYLSIEQTVRSVEAQQLGVMSVYFN